MKALLIRSPTLALLLVLGTLAIAGCGSSSSSSSSNGAAPSTAATTAGVSHAKTKFVLHAGLAFGAFHRWIYKPVKAGDLAHPLSHKAALVKAALASAFVYHELKLALHDAQADPKLSKLVAPITALQTRFADLGPKLKSGSVSSSDITQDNSSISSISSQSAADGEPITEQTPAKP